MRFLKSYKQFEEYDEQIGPDIDLGLKISYQELLDSSNLVELDFESLFKAYDTDLENLVTGSDFLSEVATRDLVASQVFDTKEIANLLEEDIRYVFLYSKNDDEQNIDPVYILIETPSEIKLYYTSEDLNRFHEKIANRVIKVKDLSDPNTTYIYGTSNAGVNWNLQNMTNQTEKFKKELYGETLMKWLNDGEIEVVGTN